MNEQDKFSGAPNLPQHQVDDAKRATDAVWQFIVSLKSVKKRNGEIVDFQIEKLERSIGAAFQGAGKQDEFHVRSIAEQVYERLQQQFDGAIVPTADQVREAVVAQLRQNGLPEIAAAYASFKTGKKTSLPPSAFMPIPLNERQTFSSKTEPAPAAASLSGEAFTPRRRRLNEERKAITHKFQVGSQEGYFTVGLYDDGQPGEIFITVSKQGSVMSGLMDAFATSVSIGLQYGVPLKVLVNKFAHARFEPSGQTQNPNIPVASSIVDYIFRWLALKFLTPEERQTIGIFETESATASTLDVSNVDGSRQTKLLDSSV